MQPVLVMVGVLDTLWVRDTEEHTVPVEEMVRVKVPLWVMVAQEETLGEGDWVGVYVPLLEWLGDTVLVLHPEGVGDWEGEMV